MKTKRRTVIVEWSEHCGGARIVRWSQAKNDFTVLFRKRNLSVKEIACQLKSDWKNFQSPSELLIRNKRTGEFSQDKRTYGLDPRKRKG